MGIADIPTALINHFDHYMNVSDSAVKESGTDQHFTFNIQIPGSPVYQAFLPNLQKFIPATISGNFNGGLQQLNVTGNFPQVQYGNMEVDSLAFNLASNRQAINYNVSLSSFSLADNEILNTSLAGTVQNESLAFDLRIKDAAKTLQYNFPGSIRKEKMNNALAFSKEGLLLNYENWSATSDNLH